MEWKKKLLVLGVFISSLNMVLAQGMGSFEAGNKAYNQGEFQSAIRAYQEVLEGGEHSFELYFNLGNAYYKLNDVANSIYYYEKAALLNPNHPSLQVNLTYANQMTIDAISEKSESGISKVFNDFVLSIELQSWSVLSLVFMFLFVAAYIVFLLWSATAVKRLAFTMSLLLIFLSLSTYGLANHHQTLSTKDQPAIVFENVLVKAEPNERGAKLFELHQGTKVQLLDQLGEWAHIQLADGQEGWLMYQSIKPIK